VPSSLPLGQVLGRVLRLWVGWREGLEGQTAASEGLTAGRLTNQRPGDTQQQQQQQQKRWAWFGVHIIIRTTTN